MVAFDAVEFELIAKQDGNTANTSTDFGDQAAVLAKRLSIVGCS